MARSIERVIKDTIREMDNASMYDRTFDYEFEEALRDEDRFLDDDEIESDEYEEDEWDYEPVSVDEFYSMKLSRADMGW
jgi:hypothetical protein